MTRRIVPQQVLHPSVAETTTGSSPVFGFGGHHAVFVLDITAASGTTPTLDINIEEWDELSDTYTVIDTIPQQTGVAKVRQVINGDTTVFGNKIRATWTIGGTTPSFTFTLSATEKE